MSAGTETRYALSGDIHIAYQLVGDGPFDLVFVPGFVTHMELQWRLPGFESFLTDLGSFSRLIRFDKRGTGMSDPVSGAPSLETRMDDVRAVMDAVGSHRAAFYGLSEGAAMSILFAATYPERTAALVLRSCSPRTLWAPDFPWGRSEAAYQRQVEQALGVYASRAEARAAVHALGMRDDDEIEAFIDYVRYGASPGMLEALYRMNREIDVRDVLPMVRVPTLVMHGSEDEVVPVELGAYMARRLPSARLVELEGIGHLSLRAGGVRIQAELERFLRTCGSPADGRRRSPTECSPRFCLPTSSTRRPRRSSSVIGGGAICSRVITRWCDANSCASAAGRSTRPATAFSPRLTVQRGRSAAPAQWSTESWLGLSIRAGLHTGECEIADGKVAGIAVHTGARVAALAKADEVLVSSTVKDLVAGSGITFTERGPHELKGIPGEWRLFAVEGDG